MTTAVATSAASPDDKKHPAGSLWKMTDVERFLGMSRRTVERLIATGGFPKPIHFGARCLRFVEAEIREWFRAKLEKRAQRYHQQTSDTKGSV